MWQCYYQTLSVLSRSEHPQLAWTLSNCCSCPEEYFSKGTYIWALCWLCEIFEKSCFGSLLIWRWWENSLFTWFLQSWEWDPEAMQHIWGRLQGREGGLDFPPWSSLREMIFLHRAPDVAGVSGYFVVYLSIPAQLLFWCHDVMLSRPRWQMGTTPHMYLGRRQMEFHERHIFRAFFSLNFKGLL